MKAGAETVRTAMAGRWYRETLQAARALGLPDWAIGAGFVRNAVWDRLSGLPRTPLDDVDVLFFDPADTSRERETALEARLAAALPRPWSVRNQARMHLRNGDAPYRSTEDAMRHWLETPTAVAVRLEADGSLAILAPFGLDDLLAMRGAPTPAGRAKPDQYRERMQAKDWPARWPGVTLVWPD